MWKTCIKHLYTVDLVNPNRAGPDPHPKHEISGLTDAINWLWISLTKTLMYMYYDITVVRKETAS